MTERGSYCVAHSVSDIDLAIDIQPSLGRTPAQRLGFVSNTFIFMDENAERIGIYSQRVLKQNPTSEPSPHSVITS